MYFNEGQPKNWKIAQVSVTGGPTALIETTFADPNIAALAHDGSALLAYGEGSNFPAPLWMIPLPAGEAHRIGGYEAQWADIFPDDRIAFTTFTNEKYTKGTESDLFIADKDGLNPLKLASVPGYAYSVNVSPDGQRILFEENRDSQKLLHEIAADGTGLREILKFGKNDCCYVLEFGWEISPVLIRQWKTIRYLGPSFGRNAFTPLKRTDPAYNRANVLQGAIPEPRWKSRSSPSAQRSVLNWFAMI
ncbi:MAG: hypothetical protein WA869_22455 [Alloacidobacterium sp.]